ncbi:pseudaminic acid synthase [Aquimarina rubra]|uniref:Pseudaminic acid synthase n=1 Tax=Aquimarina rubra TaxID=1920033 RepID=A0ABW5LG40_9FLAO
MVLTDKTFIIAELSANHNNNFQLAKDTIYAMKESGADAVKFQTYTADSITLNVDNKYFGPRDSGIWKGKTLYEIFTEGSMPWEWQAKLLEYANELDLICFSSPFDFKAVDFLEELHVPMYKIASLEISDIPLISYVASKGKPIILSTGIANLNDIELAVNACRKEGNNDITLLKCTSAYPTPFEEVNLKVIPNLRETFNVKVGLSDHTMGSTVPLGAVALGAKVVEKHFILDRNLGGVDSSFSMEPDEFKFMVKSIRELEKALGSVSYELTEKQKDTKIRGRSLFISSKVKKGEVLTKNNVKSVRPGLGLHPKYFYDVLGKKANRDITAGSPLDWSMIE